MSTFIWNNRTLAENCATGDSWYPCNLSICIFEFESKQLKLVRILGINFWLLKDGARGRSHHLELTLFRSPCHNFFTLIKLQEMVTDSISRETARASQIIVHFTSHYLLFNLASAESNELRSSNDVIFEPFASKCVHKVLRFHAVKYSGYNEH